ncbi:MAG: PDDEXK nuclease domain-containing protein [Arcobacteraceae bacterium]|jgi:predicted nuclease of restriction endonuclease-like (RecB) superfamily|nr:PDDEXK nuclease domain-containing protein [Arcobacteraceae bacterium]MDY0365667.1 PDDEXK nuclease domain-containing protein [Arcobacteraceae bacterium]
MSNIIKNDLIQNIRNLLIASRNQVVQTVNSVMVQTYWNIGKMIVEDEQNGETRAEYGKKQLQSISKTLTDEFGKGFDTTNLRKMRQFYLVFPNQDSVSLKLTWTHYRTLIRVENQSAREWYIQEAITNNWSVRALERQILKLYYERLLSSNDKTPLIDEANENIKALQTTEQTTDIKNYLRDPYVFDFLNLPNEALLETNIEQALIDNLQKFLLELGRGFAFVERQQRLSVEEQDFYIDLVFYNFKLKCFLLIDLKLGKLTHQDVGQMDTYVRVYDKFHKSQDDNPTIGLILCSESSQAVAKYSVLSESKQLFSSKYLPFLPTIEELEYELEIRRDMITSDATNE